MRLLLLNPNSTQEVTDRIAKAAALYQQPGVEITVATAVKGPAAIETSYDELVASNAVLEELNTRRDTFDGAAICCFSDPGLLAAQELFEQPIVGMCQSAVYFSSLFSRRFSILGSCDQGDIGAFINEMKGYGAAERLASVEYLGTGVLGVPDHITDEISEKIDACIKKEGVGAVLLGCAAFSGLSEELSKKHGIFVSEGIGPAIMTLKMLIERKQTLK